jgi:hypothetical protein
MAIMRRFVDRAGQAIALIALAALPVAAPPVQAASGSFEAAAGGMQAHYDPAARETRVSGRVGRGLCFSFGLPQQWHLNTEGPEMRLEAVSSGARLGMGLRSAETLRHLPQRDLASRDAAFLQKDYEEVLGRPAQSASLTSPIAGAVRWSATWIDANLPTPSHAMTVEALIVPLSAEWVLELTPEGIENLTADEVVAQPLPRGLNVQSGLACQG